MRYNSMSDGTLLRRRSMGPVRASAQRSFAMPIPGRGLEGLQHRAGNRVSLRGFGATSIAPVGAGAGAGAAIGAQQGASIGSAIVPGIGTAIGAVVGAIGGAIAGAINKTDPENVDFNAAVALWQQNPNAVYSIGNPYLALAGLFDLNITTNIPIYKKFGRMGEAAFVVWLCNAVYAAAQQGQISSGDTALTVMSRIIQPQIDAWGYGPMQDPHADLITRLIQTMILQYTAGLQGNWYSVGGGYPTQFRSIPPFSLPAATPTASPTPSPMASTASSAPVQIYSNNGATLTVGKTGQNVVLRDAAMVTYQFAPTTGSTAQMLMNGQPVNGMMAYTATLYNGAAYVKLQPGTTWGDGSTTYTWNDSAVQWQQVADPLGGTAASSATTTTTPAISTTPPAIGAALSAMMDAVTHTMLGIPGGGTYGGLTPAGAWIVIYPPGVPAGQSGGQFTLQSGAFQVYTVPATATSTSTTPTAGTSVSTTPPAIGASIAYVQDNTTGQMVAIPSGGTYAGLTSTGGWLVTYSSNSGVPAGTYESNNGSLTLFSGSTTASTVSTAAVPAGYTATGQSVLLNGQPYPLYMDTQGNDYVWTGGTMVPYSSAPASSTAQSVSSGGGGGYYPGYGAPTVSTPADVSAAPLVTESTGFSPVWWIGGALGLWLLVQ